MKNLHKLALLSFSGFTLLVFATGCIDAERRALLDVKSLLIDPSNRLKSWQGEECCRWKGIKCSDLGNVVSLNLRNPNPESFLVNLNSELIPASSNANTSTSLKGTISRSLFTLNQIRYLDLSYNDFNSSTLPSGLSNLTRLTYLNLSNSMFEDFITTQFANLTSLTQLDLSCSTEISDSSGISVSLTSSSRLIYGSVFSYIPNGNLYSSNLNWLLGLTNLMELRLTGVDLSEASQSTSWAEPISSLINLSTLYLSNCSLSGRIPINHLLNLSQLHSLIMDSNNLSSQIPDQLANITSLSELDLRNCNLHGSVPYLPQLKGLYAGYNYGLTIDLNSMFSVPWSSLERLDIQYAQVGGSIPDSFANTTTLVSFVASNCSIQGSLPLSITNLSRLEILQLNDNNIRGHLPPTLSNMKSLWFLSLSQNFLSGSIPVTICDMDSLNYLNLYYNQLTGVLPECIAYLPNLSILVVTRNFLVGSVLISSFQSSKLQFIGLGSNTLSVKTDNDSSKLNFNVQVLELASCNIGGGIPNFISTQTELIFLNLYNNSLSGPIPSWLFNLPSLSSLDLSENNLHGSIPSHIQLHSSIVPKSLNLANNKLQGAIPTQLENVEVINLSGNNFSGLVPTEIGESSSLRYISFAGNKLYGQIPPSFGNKLNALEVLDLSNNSLSGRIPLSLGNCTSLVFLSLGGNNLDGNIPFELQGAKHLRYLDLSGNDFNGTFPNVIRRFLSLEGLKLENNRFVGRIPEFIGELYNLRLLVLASNMFSGSIPQEIMKLEKLQYIGFSNNSLSGPIPEKLENLKMLTVRPTDGTVLGFLISAAFVGVELDIVTKGSSYKLELVYSYHSGIDISLNALTGSIPGEIGLLQGLSMLNLSHNHLSGVIPRTIGNMSGLESLDLSFNTLSGEVPRTLTNLDFLGVLNLSYNNLSGKVPVAPHLDTLDRYGFYGNQFLCGAPDVKVSCNNIEYPTTETNIEASDSEENFLLVGIIAMGYGCGLSVFFLVLFMMTEKWKEVYCRITDGIVLGIIEYLQGDKKRVSNLKGDRKKVSNPQGDRKRVSTSW
ncbi:leucine-rich repeat receptor-like protein kinase PXL1 [Heracleum sosnowskyi]|uniref:Leucine-rich repeat receptor-like protein kinase PXL1 n=1 Tax=Heracleum sosnowskyi TaxID=360622 RepID=A0AAD8MEE0_9APIA|nr:leucine-rich repeat receptor-like protein kinase PXL1 [Heracleum sosnowskyi]